MLCNWRVQLRTRPTVLVLLRASRCPQMTKTWTKNRGTGDWGQRVKGKLLCKRWTEQEERGRMRVEEILFQGQRRNNRDKNRERKADFTIFLLQCNECKPEGYMHITAMIPLRFKKYEIQQTSWRSHGLIDAFWMADFDLCVFKSHIPLAQQSTDSEPLSQRRRCIWSTSVYEDRHQNSLSLF